MCDGNQWDEVWVVKFISRVFGLSVYKIDFEIIEFERVDFNKIEFNKSLRILLILWISLTTDYDSRLALRVQLPNI